MDNPGEQEFSQIIEKSFTAILSGESTLDAILARYPERSAELRAELEAAMWLLSRRDEVSSRAGFVPASRKRLVGRLQAETQAKSRSGKRASLGVIWPRRFVLQFSAALTIFILLFISMFGTVSASQSAVPGDSFYAIKRLSEDVQYTFTFSTTRRAQLCLAFSDRRLDEVEYLIAHGQYEYVAQTLNDFEYKVNQSIALLQEGEAVNGSQSAALAASLEAQLTGQTAQLTNLLQIAPDSVLNGLERAMDVSLRGRQTADEMILKEHPTKTPNDGNVSPVTKTPGPSNQNNQSVKTPGGQNNSAPGIVATKTPRPTLEKKPTKTDKPLPEAKPEKPTKEEDSSEDGSLPPDTPPDKVKEPKDKDK